MTTERCGQVFPHWVELGWVLWSGTGQRERMFNIEYRRCTAPVVALKRKDGFVFQLCAEHGASP